MTRKHFDGPTIYLLVWIILTTLGAAALFLGFIATAEVGMAVCAALCVFAAIVFSAVLKWGSRGIRSVK